METPSPDFVFIAVEDDGCGIADDDVKTIFDPFMTTKASGTGLGLSIVHSILDSYNGELSVDSKLGTGSIFTIKLKSAQLPSGNHVQD
jgi:signal transduction histidine kinase